MSSVSSCSVFQSREIINSIADKVSSKSRVSTNNLQKLLKTIKNTPEGFSCNEYKKTREKLYKMADILEKQNSKKYEKKSLVLNNACNLLEKKLSPEGIADRVKVAKDSFTKEINEAVKTIKNKMEVIKGKANSFEEELNKTIESLPSKESKEEAIKNINKRSLSIFRENSATTRRLFPSTLVKVEREYSLQNQRHNHRDLNKWTSIPHISEQLKDAKNLLNKAEGYISDSRNLEFNQPDEVGRFDRTTHQTDLVKFAAEINDHVNNLDYPNVKF
ncbi:hypothetical protein GKQ23_09235 [Erwinia sp. E602]|uniref:hypothetical protein n=1 Tax=Erwinia sp. E602 TaxID=2675378 RepID=UPI001BA77702|nr:hypothetical protein [Erwinia sp. E602]QUG75161.1 hypothetical protein GKQ23_09235 [Erwinia sp. E602]